jgi:transposase
MKIVVFIEGGLVTGVVDVDAPEPEKGIEYDIVDYDVLEGNSSTEVKEYFEGRDEATLEYMKRVLPDEYQLFVEASKEEG